MSNKKEIVKVIKERIKSNIPKIEIEKELVSKYKTEEFIKILADFPEPELRKKYKTHNIVLIIFVVIATLLKLISIVVMEPGTVPISFLLLISIIIPTILIVGLLSFRKNSYGLTAAVSIFSLLPFLKNPGELVYLNSMLVLISIIVILSLSLFLRKKIYPKNIVKIETQISQ